MGQAGSNPGQGPNRQNKDQKKVDETDCFHLLGSKSNYFLKDDKPKDDKSRFERAPPTRVGKRKRGKGPDPSSKLPTGNFKIIIEKFFIRLKNVYYFFFMIGVYEYLSN